MPLFSPLFALVAEAGVDFHTYRSNTRDGWTTTSIDHVLSVGPVREQSYDLKVFWPREQGHAVVACSVCLCTPMQSRCQIVVPPSLQVHVPNVDWPLLLPGTAFAMWDAFAARVSSFVPGCVSKGSFPKFKVRDDFSYSQVAEKVRDAIIQEDYASCNLLLKDLNRISSRMLANWRKGPLTLRDGFAEIPLRFLFRCRAKMALIRALLVLGKCKSQFMFSITISSTNMSINVLRGRILSLPAPRKILCRFFLLLSAK